MFKKGFTLAEVLVALSIVGVVAAISAPALSNMMPDKDKLAVLKAYKILNDATQEIINDPGLYINGSDNSNCIGLSCTTQPVSIPQETAELAGDAKFAHLLHRNLNGDLRLNPENNRDEQNFATQLNNLTYTFTTNDQVEWQVLRDNNRYFVSIDIDGAGTGRDCFMGDEGCNKSDRFQYIVSEEGNVSGNDALTRAYISTRTNVRNRAADLRAANRILDNEEIDLRGWVN